MSRFLLVSLQVLHCARRWCSTFYEADKSEIKDRDSDEDKLDSIATKHREMQDAITQARRQVCTLTWERKRERESECVCLCVCLYIVLCLDQPYSPDVSVNYEYA